MVDRREIASPTCKGRRNSIWLPAHMRRGRVIGGRKPSLTGWPSVPSCDCRGAGRKYVQCQSGGTLPQRIVLSSLVVQRRGHAAQRCGRDKVFSNFLSTSVHARSASLFICDFR